MENKSIILLSGGLDSLVSLGLGVEEYNVKLALTIDYGQRSAEKEIEASRKISDYYGIENKVIKLPFLGEITDNAYVKGGDLPSDNIGTKESAKAVWVPNRNGLFLNIAAAFADSFGYSHILFGANKQEGLTFPDNSKEFISGINESLKFSTLNGVQVVTPLINYDKDDIVRIALERDIPLELAYSCYEGGDKNCGMCESCQNLKKALLNNNALGYIEQLF